MPLKQFFDGKRERTFATLGRVATEFGEDFPWRLDSEKREIIQERALKESRGEDWLPYEETGLTPQDILAFAAEGAKPTSANLEESIRLWWKRRESSPLWQKKESPQKPPLIERLFDARSKKIANRIISELGFGEDEGFALFRRDRFSLRTVYTRDYTPVPKELKALFKMVPHLVFSPRTTQQLQRFMKYAGEKNIRVAPRGRGTWALGGALLTQGGVVLEMASFEKKIAVHPENHTITVSASVDFQEAEEALNGHNLTLMVRPSNKYGAIAGFLSVGEPFKGGLGLNAFSFGPIRNSVESIRVITGRGEERFLSKDHEDFPYFLGTNGRYGVITEITLKALPLPEKHFPLALHFLSAENAFGFLQSLQGELEQGTITCRPIHVEFFGKAYLDELNRIKAAEESVNEENLISPESLRKNTPAKDTVLFVFYQKEAWQEFTDYVNTRNGFGFAPQKVAEELWQERFSPMKLRKKGDLLTAEVILPLDEVVHYLKEIINLAANLGIKILPVAYLLNSNEALLLPQFLTDRRHPFQYYRHFSLVPVLARRATKRYHGRPYGYGIWFAGLLRRALGNDIFHDLRITKKRFDPKGILNPGKLNEIRSRLWNQFGKILLHERGIDLLDLALRFQAKVTHAPKFQAIFLSSKLKPYQRKQGDALHRCIKCSACMICPLAQIWEKSGDSKLMKDAIYITPRFKMEYMQRHLFEGKKLTQEDVNRFVLCFRCGVAEREQVCPISDMLLEVEQGETTPCEKKLPTYDEFEERLRKEGYDVDGAIQCYLDILKTHPGVARAMQEVLGKYRVPKTGDLVVLQPKTDFAIYKVEVDPDRCLNCGKCGDEHTTCQRGFWDPRNPRKMVSLDDLLRELHGKIPKSWFRDQGGPIPTVLKNQGKSNDEYVYFPKPSPLDAGHHHCNGCLYCVIECPVDAIRVKINDYYVGLAGKDFTREDVRRINEEARTGDVPTSGTGSTGLFGGKGFDRYMFDFSVIVRPTRDGIREAIDIGVNLGRKPLFHVFENNGSQFPRIKSHFHTLDLPTPILLELPPVKGRQSVRDLADIFARCAHREGTLLFLNLFQFMENFEAIKYFSKNLGLRLLPEEIETVKSWLDQGEADASFKRAVRQIPLVEIAYETPSNSKNDPVRDEKQIREIFAGNLIISHLLICPVNADPENIGEQVEYLAKSGAEVIHLKTHYNPEKSYYESAELLPACYDRLLTQSLHTQVTLISNGVKSPADLGISMMLGASATVVDRAALVALNHEFPMLEKNGESLPEIEIGEGVRRLQNLFNSWHKQIREVLGAFGVRDIRRTVGEGGRLIDLRAREKKMRAIVEDKKLLMAAKESNQQKIKEDGDLARAASWKYSNLSGLIRPVPPPNANLLGERSESLESMLDARGDRRWNAEMLTATWLMSSGVVPSHQVPQMGCDFGGGSFDTMKFAPVNFNGKTITLEAAVEEIEKKIKMGDQQTITALDSLSISAGVINKHRGPGSPPLVNRFPIDAADMSLGSIGWKLTLARYLAGLVLNRYTGTGEGGYPLEKYERIARFFPSLAHEEVQWLARQLERWVATQTATGYFGVTEDTIRRAKKLVLKFAQGAKPGLGGHILGPKVTLQVEDLRGVIAGISVFSPFPFHDVYSIEDVTKMIEWLRTINPDAIITVKISTPVDVYHVALGLVTGGADEIQIDATAGGTGAAPDIARNRIAMPLEYALSDVHKFLVEQGERNKVVLVASGGIRSAYDMAKALILGADKVILGTQEIVSQQCNRCGNCEAPGGCQKGITTTVEQLEEQKEIILNAQWLINAQVAVVQHLMKMMYVWGIKDIRELRGRWDLIESWGWEEERRDRSGIREQGLEVEKKRGKVFTNGWNASSEERRELDACGVVSFACTQAVPVESIQTACQRMHNRGNGRGGGILGLGGMFSEQFEDCYALQIITLVPEKQRKRKILEIVKNHLQEFEIYQRDGEILHAQELSASNLESFRNPRRQKEGRDITWEEAGLAVDPGDLYRFFVRVKKEVLLDFAREVLEKCRISDSEKRILENGNPTRFLQGLNIAGKWIDYFVKYHDLLTDQYLNSVQPGSKFWQEPKYESLWRDLEDEYVYRRAFEINQKYYIEPQNRSETPEAFVSSMMKDGGIWKLVGYAEQAADYWIVGDAQYVSMAELDKTIDEIFAEENAKFKIQNTDCKTLVANFQKKDKPKLLQLKPNNFMKWREEGSQLEITIGSQKNRKITIIAPKDGNRAVVVYKYGAHVWIGHQRFPTVFSPYSGGSHPFYGRVDEALIHNGDFANYVAMVRFWDQFGGAPQFRTDTEMAAKAYAILKQMGYPQTHLFEAIAPTTGIDLQRLKKTNPELAADFEAIQKSQIAGSPDGPWFFIIGDQDPLSRDLRVIGLTDTSVLRPSAFVWQQSSNGKYASIGLVGSEEQACRSVLETLHKRGVLASKEPDAVKIIRGGSVEQDSAGEIRGGGAMVYHLKRRRLGEYEFMVKDKFGNVYNQETGYHYDLKSRLNFDTEEVLFLADQIFDSKGKLKLRRPETIFQLVKKNLITWEYNTFRWLVETLGNYAQTDEQRTLVIEALTWIKDRIQSIDVGEEQKSKRRSSLIQILTDELDAIFDKIEKLGSGPKSRKYFRLTWLERDQILPCQRQENILVVDATGFPAEGHESLARILVHAYEQGWRKFMVYKIAGQRYLGAGFGPNTHDLELHLYGSPGQDIANSLMGGTVHVHADAQNDMCKIIHSGTVVVHGLAGNTGIYGAKGGEIFVRDSVGTRWVINSVSSPAGPGLKVIIVGTAMEYLAESLMGGVVLMLGLQWDEHGILRHKYLPFAGNSILAGASAGKVIVYDPDNRLQQEQYAGATDVGFLSSDWAAVYKKLANLVATTFSKEAWIQKLERWHSLAKFSLKSEALSWQEKQTALDELTDLLKQILDTDARVEQIVVETQIFKALVEDRFTGKEWRTLVRLLGQILTETSWKEGIELLERMRDWKEVTELLVKADKYFNLGLTVEEGWLYLPMDGKKTEIKREDFKVLRPLRPEEKKELEKKKLEEVESEEVRLVEEFLD